jgi:hypothetical protein
MKGSWTARNIAMAIMRSCECKEWLELSAPKQPSALRFPWRAIMYPASCTRDCASGMRKPRRMIREDIAAGSILENEKAVWESRLIFFVASLIRFVSCILAELQFTGGDTIDVRKEVVCKEVPDGALRGLVAPAWISQSQVAGPSNNAGAIFNSIPVAELRAFFPALAGFPYSDGIKFDDAKPRGSVKLRSKYAVYDHSPCA